MSKNIAELNKAVSLSGKEFIEQQKDQKKVISMSPTLNYVLGGGILEGSFIVLTGLYKAGKTSSALSMAREIQKAGYKIIYFNVEHRLSVRDLMSASGLDVSEDKLVIIKSNENYILSAEQIMELVRYRMTTEEKCMCIVDSVSQLCPSDLLAGEVGDKYRDATPKILSQFSKVMAPIIDVTGNIFLAITHEIANTSGMGRKQTVEASGRKIQYAHDFKLRTSWGEPWIEDKEQIGQKIHWQCTTSKLGPPNREAVSFLRYNIGLDKGAEIVNLLKECQHPIMKVKGAWYTFKDGEYKAQGQNKAIDLVNSNEELYKELEEALWERLGNKVELDVAEDDGAGQ